MNEEQLRMLDEEVSAEVMGLHPQDLRMLTWPRAVRPYSTDIRAAWDMEAVINLQGLASEYGEGVSILLHSQFITATFYDFLHASPELRCRAALAAVRGEVQSLRMPAPTE